MRLTLLDPADGQIRVKKGPWEPVSLSRSPDGRYAVAEIFANELFVALEILDEDGEDLVGRYVDHFTDMDIVPMLKRYSVDWSCICYGFAKLVLFAPEMSEEFGGYFDQTMRRFWFDRELYERKYLEMHGVPAPHRDKSREKEGREESGHEER